LAKVILYNGPLLTLKPIEAFSTEYANLISMLLQRSLYRNVYGQDSKREQKI